nr:envelope protein 2 variant 17 [Hepacivirus hominis]MOZ57907.1 envelope protein 2 variant 112 [Hepacivirus hominis]MOZ57973.1 envelope protein 2 variant 178 [Hepacivirus hominis]MOZ57991.1 envelope protein 2 variant 196 [Hepacivirus hominis]MOZ58094.1 envelope protein 2 variant 299 [Hepacivirus hominis]
TTHITGGSAAYGVRGFTSLFTSGAQQK